MARRTLIIRVLGVLALLGLALAATRAGWGADVMAWGAAFGYFLVMMTFARTLGRGREPLITSYCRLDFGSVPDECLTYTRRLTQLWAVLMGALVVETVAIQLSGRASTWLGPAGVVNLCLLVVVFVGEHWLRGVIYPHLPKASLLRTGQIMLRWFLVRG
jgi:uncharacterized membrane protein